MLTNGEVEPQYQISMPETTLRDFYRREGIRWQRPNIKLGGRKSD